ncbi:MAG: hypothetical protein ACJASR_000262 [Psychroserpens sp.]|jgi:hypothetical protein
MNEIHHNIKFQQLDNILEQKIRTHLNKLNKSDNQKNLELCQVGKLLGTYFPEYNILETRESPDFIIKNGFEKIGVEHELIIDSTLKKKEGFYENICKKVEEKLDENKNMPNFLVNCLFKSDLDYKIREKGEIINSITSIISDYVLESKFPDNKFFHSIMKMNHSRKTINANFGAHIQNPITKSHISSAIKKKELKIENYINNTVQLQWLVLVIGSSGESSFEVDKLFEYNITSSFSKIFLYEDFNNRLFELK